MTKENKNNELSEAETASKSDFSALLCVFAVWIVGHSPRIPDEPPIAIFIHEDHATEWARDNYRNQYFLKQIEIPFIQFCTDEERKRAGIEAAEMVSFFNPLDSAIDA